MDVDPLSDTVPPRYAIESDEEEDEYNPLRITSSSNEDTKFDIKIVGSIPTNENLVMASRDAGRLWARGANLGEQIGAVTVNGVQMGLAFRPSWTTSTIIVSEALSKLPLSAMHRYAETIIESFKPRRVVLLDLYALPTYSSHTSTSLEDAPIRYLTTSKETGLLDSSKAEPFLPPNLLQSTSASIISLLSVASVDVTLLLLPTPHIPSAPPKTISHSDITHLEGNEAELPTDLINTAHRLLFQLLGDEEGSLTEWKLKDTGKISKEKLAKRNTEVGEGSMYI